MRWREREFFCAMRTAGPLRLPGESARLQSAAIIFPSAIGGIGSSANTDVGVCLTGDHGRFLRNGALVFLGRKDSAVKIRGQTVQTAEIERALLTHGEVQQARVVAFNNEQEQRFLAAYLVTA